MIYRTLAGEKVSFLGMGNMRLPIQGSVPNSPIDRERAQAIIDYAYAHGINYFDTAFVYHGGESEKFLGGALKAYPRESYYLADKFLLLANPDYKAVLAEQLQRLQTDYIDFYLLHSISDHTVPQYLDSGAIEYFLEQKEKGVIRHLGFSSHASLENLTRFADHHAWEFAQIQCNYYDWKYSTAAAEYEILNARNIPTIVMEPCRGGRLANLTDEANALLRAQKPAESIASWAFNFVKDLPNVKLVLSGMSSLEQIEDNVKTFSVEQTMSAAEKAVLEKANEAFHHALQIPCTGCAYCCEECPQEINIPLALTFYNAFKLGGIMSPNVQGLLAELARGNGPQDCLDCGACETICPQNIAIPAILQEIAALPARP